MSKSVLPEAHKRHLRRLAHDRKVIVQTGANGLTDAVLRELDGALASHELVKARFLAAERADRDAMIERACSALGCALVLRIGHVAVLYRANPDKADRIELPR